MASTDIQARAAIYRKAARLMETRAGYCGTPVMYACHALEMAGDGSERFCRRLKEVFAPTDYEGAWLCVPEFDFEARLDFRILALCMMAAMVEAGDA